MKAYAVLSLLLVCNVGGDKVVESSKAPQIIVENQNEIVHEQLSKLDPGDKLVFDPFLAETPLETLQDTEDKLKDLVLFYLYNLDNKFVGHQLYLNDEEALKRSKFDSSKPTRFITHGWLKTLLNESITLVRDAYLENGDYNVIGIDWSKIAHNKYEYASNRVPMVGRYVTKFINFLQTQGLDLSTVTMVGHSLGAHVVGLAARSANGDVDHVIGLDPARPSFENAGPNGRISIEDAGYVQVIHTDTDVMGFGKPIGHIDFYPNGYNSQPGCDSNLCSSFRAYKYFAESINSDIGFLAHECDSFEDYIAGKCVSNSNANLGGPTPNYLAKGIYFLSVNSVSPYAQGDRHIVKP